MIIGIAVHRGIQPPVLHTVKVLLTDERNSLVTAEESSIPEARASLFRQAANRDDDLLILDEDVEPTPFAVSRLQIFQEPVVAGIYLLRQKWILPGEVTHPLSVGWFAEMKDGTQHLKLPPAVPTYEKEYERVDFASPGFCLFRREVVKRVSIHSFRSLVTSDDGVAFGLWAKEQGIPIHVCWRASARHWALEPLEVLK